MPTNTSPQSVSRRYAYNILNRGANKDFELDIVDQAVARTEGGMPCGFYYKARVKRRVTFVTSSGEGLTPIEAVISALHLTGVTFR